MSLIRVPENMRLVHRIFLKLLNCILFAVYEVLMERKIEYVVLRKIHKSIANKFIEILDKLQYYYNS